MPDLGLDLRYLRNLIVAAEQGSFRRAAEVLGASQSSITRRVQLLERRLGFAVFDRTPAGIRLTRAGARFLSEAARGVNYLDRAMQLAASADRGERGVIHVGILASLNSGHLREMLAAFRDKHPNVEVVIHEATPQECLHCLATGHLDILFLTGVEAAPGYLAEMLWKESVFIAMPSEHPLAGRDEITWDEVRHETFIVSAGGPGAEIHNFLVRRLAEFGFQPDVRIQQVGRETLMNLVAIGYGLTLVETSFVDTKQQGVVACRVAGETGVLESSAIWSARNSNPALKRLMSVARAVKIAAASARRTAVGILMPLMALLAPPGVPAQIPDLFL
ncbi:MULTISPECIES: LysR family transcriptional regulator [Alphaproteobacteria]|jgi:DNA-binding transcriptional LysR family regulator|uniref:LysR family transcriptional regulator n=1 Tax=Alphaproteobacteria TaxID=28211 RepID=UPI000A747E67|nr:MULTISPECIES: LysR family transcriptional regulator [Alphaproteobacteria]WCP11643.1 HTH-type transcriptional regulator HdfR [Sphingobium sp. AntQ-1]